MGRATMPGRTTITIPRMPLRPAAIWTSMSRWPAAASHSNGLSMQGRGISARSWMWRPRAASQPIACHSGTTPRRWPPSAARPKRMPAAGCSWVPSSTSGPSSPTIGLEADLRREFHGAMLRFAHCLAIGFLGLVGPVLGKLAGICWHQPAALRQHLVELAVAADHRDGAAPAREDAAHVGGKRGEILLLVGIRLHQIVVGAHEFVDEAFVHHRQIGDHPAGFLERPIISQPDEFAFERDVGIKGKGAAG